MQSVFWPTLYVYIVKCVLKRSDVRWIVLYLDRASDGIRCHRLCVGPIQFSSIQLQIYIALYVENESEALYLLTYLGRC